MRSLARGNALQHPLRTGTIRRIRVSSVCAVSFALFLAAGLADTSRAETTRPFHLGVQGGDISYLANGIASSADSTFDLLVDIPAP